MKFISLFSGIGGFDLAFERAGMECVAVCEIDKNAQSVLRRHFPKAELFDDVRKVGKETHERKSIDLVCGGFPCQDVSIAGKRAGIAGERSGLWFEFARIIDELEPHWVVIENVPGLLSSNNGKDFAVIVQWLAQRGYGVTWRILDAQYFGVPQRRRRVFVVASFGNGSAAEILFESEGSTWNNPPSREAGKEVAYSLRANPSHSGDKGDGGINTTMVAGTLSASAGGLNRPAGQGNELDFLVPSRDVAETITQNNYNGLGGGKTSPKISVVMAHGQANAEIVNDGSPSLTDNHEQPILFEQVWDSAQITSKQHGSKPSEISQPLNTLLGMMVGVRRLTPIECERLQGFPDGWTDYSLKLGHSVIMSAWLKTFAQFLNVDEKWLTENWGSVSCTTRDTKNMGQRICLNDMTPQTTNAKSVIGWLEKVEQEDFVQGIINPGSVMVTRDSQTDTWKSSPISKQDDLKYTGQLWKISLVGNYDQENLSTILTWMKQTTLLRTSISAKTEMNTEKFMILWSEPQSSYSRAENWCLRMDDIAYQSDSARYRQLGNAVAVPVVEWIAKRIVKAETRITLLAQDGGDSPALPA